MEQKRTIQDLIPNLQKARAIMKSDKFRTVKNENVIKNSSPMVNESSPSVSQEPVNDGYIEREPPVTNLPTNIRESLSKMPPVVMQPLTHGPTDNLTNEMIRQVRGEEVSTVRENRQPQPRVVYQQPPSNLPSMDSYYTMLKELELLVDRLTKKEVINESISINENGNFKFAVNGYVYEGKIISKKKIRKKR